jgi:hypothetical protein
MRTVFRKFAILVAAYALALQPAIAAMSAAHVQAGIAFCTTADGGGAPVPATPHDSDSCCLSMGCGAAPGGVPASISIIVPVFNAAAATLAVAKPALRIAVFSARQHGARAPPV